ncbi:MAG TPA: T9SS type A sorting domain-containing protein [bacterium]|jgi:hypothetical protein
MKLFVTLFAALLLFGATAFAQITIHNTDFSSAGYSYTWGVSDDTASFSSGSAGVNQTWTFNSTYWDATERHTFVAPSSTPHGTQFPNATRADHVEPIHGSGEESYIYHQITSSQFLQIGEAFTDTIVTFQPAWLVGPLPLTYGANWTSVMYYERALVPGFIMGTRDSTLWTVDGWGTVTTPYGGTQAALRVFTRHWLTVSLNGTPLQAFQLISYAWLNQAGNSVVVLTSNAEDTDPNFTTGTIAMMGAPLAAEPVRGPVAQSLAVGQNYPNPFNPTTDIPVTLAKNSQVTLEIFDQLGQLVSREEHNLPAGSHSFAVNGSRWATGMYFARVSTGAEQQVLKMNLLK